MRLARRARVAIAAVGCLGAAFVSACLTEVYVYDEGALICEDDEVVCDGACADVEEDTANCGECSISCAPEELCEDGQCVVPCAGGGAWCDEECVDLQFDDDHCGECGNDCEDGAVCLLGECVAEEDQAPAEECESCPCDECPPEWACATTDDGVVCYEPPDHEGDGDDG